MQQAKYFKDQICDELRGATDYLKKVIDWHKTKSEWAKTFYEMAEAEEKHATTLYKMFMQMYSEAKKAQAQVDDLKKNGIRSETYKKMFDRDPDHRAYQLKYNPETGKRELDYDSKKGTQKMLDSLFPASKMKQYMESATEDVEINSALGKKYMNQHKDLMNLTINSSMSKRDVRKASKVTNKKEEAKERQKKAQELNTLIYGTEGNKKK